MHLRIFLDKYKRRRMRKRKKEKKKTDECFSKTDFWKKSARIWLTSFLGKRKNDCPQIKCDHFKTQLKKEYTQIQKYQNSEGGWGGSKLSIQTDTQNINSSIPEMAKKVLFSNISIKLNSFDKRPTRVTESTDKLLVHVIISGATSHMRLQHLYSLKLSAASPQRDRACSWTKKQKGDKEENPYREKLMSINVLPLGLSPKPGIVTGASSYQVSASLTLRFLMVLSASKTRPTMCGTWTRE